MKTESCITVSGQSSAEYTEKRSRFIAVIRHCETEHEAVSFINDIRAKHRDARHNCYAYSVSGGAVKRFSDDGEPHGTAGKPMLDIIDGEGLCNVCAVVTRYFGGVLLGTGGLSRAYSSAASEALKAAKTVKMSLFCNMRLSVDYNRYGRLPAMIAEFGGRVISSDFADDVTVSFSLPYKKEAEFCAALTELSCGSLTPQKTGECFLPE